MQPQPTTLDSMGRIIFLVTLSLMLVTVSPASAETPTLTLASVDNIPPYVFMQNGKLTGLSVDIINELAKRGDFNVSIQTSPWARVLLQVEEGAVDGAFSAYRKKEREAYSLYTGIIHYDELRVAINKSNRFEFHGIESLYDKTVGKGRGVWVSKEFNATVKAGKINLSEANDMKMINIKKLHEGRLDAVIGSPVAMQYYARELGYKNIVILPEAIKKRIPAYLILSRKSDLSDKRQWQSMLKSLLKTMHQDGTIRAIYKKYGVEDM